MKRCHAIIFSCVLALGLLGASSALSAPWEKIGKTGGISLYSQARQGSGVRAYRGVIELPRSPDEVAAIITDFDQYKAFMPNVVESRVVSRQAEEGDRQRVHYYIRLEIPALDDRDFVVLADIASKLTAEGSTWAIAYRAVSHPKVPALPDVVRLSRITGVWLLQPARGGQATRLTYELHTEFGGSVPDFMVDDQAGDALLDILERLAERCHERHGASVKQERLGLR